jgi:hypothetical protein
MAIYSLLLGLGSDSVPVKFRFPSCFVLSLLVLLILVN